MPWTNRALVAHVDAALDTLQDKSAITSDDVADVALPGARDIYPDVSDADLRDMIALIVRRKFDPTEPDEDDDLSVLDADPDAMRARADALARHADALEAEGGERDRPVDC